MKISGCTFVKNGTLLGYPYIEAIKSLLLICDEVIVAVGESVDDTLNQIKAINDSRLCIIPTKWNEVMQDRGYTYAQQKMIAQFNCTGDWVFYLECDEIIHEDDIPLIKAQMIHHFHNKEIETLIFNYHHFYGTKNTVAVSPGWYKKAPRIIRNNIRSYAPDGLFWIIMHHNKTGRYPRAALINVYIYHYGHIRSVTAMNEKNRRVEHYWGKKAKEFTTYGNIDKFILQPFNGEHPAIVDNWLLHHTEQQLHINRNYKLTSRDIRHRFLSIIESIFFNKIDFSRKHYK